MEDSESLMAVAREETGLDDFGSDSFREGLDLLVGALNSEYRQPRTRGEQSGGGARPRPAAHTPAVGRLHPALAEVDREELNDGDGSNRRTG